MLSIVATIILLLVIASCYNNINLCRKLIMAKATSDSVGATSRRKLSVMLVALLSLCISVQAESNFTVWVLRRSSVDVYHLNSSNTVIVDNCGAKPNYLVNEKQCASDEELISGMYADPMISDVCNVNYIVGCDVAVFPMNSTFLIPTTTIGSRYSAITSILSDDEFKSSREYVEIFGFNGTNQTVNSSFCDISSLEVYRGREQAIEISRRGFFLGDNGSIEVR